MRYAAPARRLARAILRDAEDADDAAQDAFLAALRTLGRYDPSRPFAPWLMRIVANAAVDRRRRRQVRRAEELPQALPSFDPGPPAHAERRELRAALEEALARLPERQRIAVVLFDAEGYSHREIAQILGVPVGTVRSDVFHGRRALRSALADWKGWTEETP
jgi:RNA polymerase sigma-70 factor (ECF subfamily)